MRTPAQIEASKKNGAKSNGPTTTAGRAKSSQNAIRHGLTSHKVIVMDGESKEEWENFQREFILKFQPRDFVEERIVIEMAVCRWRLERVWAMQTAVLNQGMTDALPLIDEQFADYDMTLVQAWAHTTRMPDLQKLDQHETRLTRRFDRALRNLNELRAQYPTQPEPETEPQTELESAPETPHSENTKLPNEPKPGIHVIYPQPISPSEQPQPDSERPHPSDSPGTQAV